MRLNPACLSLTRLISALVVLVPVAAFGAEDAGIEFFEKKIRPVLVQHCYQCHAADAKKLGGGLLLDSRDGVRKGGDSGAVIEAGKPDDSPLITAVRYKDESLRMPPKSKLPDAVIADLEAWVKMGAPDPRDKSTAVKAADSWEAILRSRRDWWSLHAIRKPAVPDVKDAGWSDHPVDRFVLSRLEAQGLAPAGDAGPGTLIRRLSLVLTGLPPTSEQVAAFARKCDAARVPSSRTGAAGGVPQGALEKLVDSLLQSPHFGERWARHWMDVVRFSETHGNEWNYEVHHAWRYRDYLIRAFNHDVPYDQFVREHIAGDLLPQPRWNAREQINESVIGTAFYRFGEANHDDCIGLRQIGYDLADNQIDTLTKAFQATTVACARCHDHKLDAISMQDYYGLLGILRSSRLVSHTLDGPDVNAGVMRQLADAKQEIRKELGEVWLRESELFSRYMLAAQARHAKRPEAEELAKGLDPARLEKWTAVLQAEKLPLEDPFEPWRAIVAAAISDETKVPTEWKKLSESCANEDRQRTEFSAKGFETFADFRGQASEGPVVQNGDGAVRNGADWQMGGLGLRQGRSPAGQIALSPDGDTLISAVLPAGCFTHAVSDKLNGTLRSPVLPLGKQHISFQVVGQRSSALRLVSNNCQLNYKNYRALTNDELQWVTFSPPDDRDALRTYAELMTMFDNPKFPDQLSALGGDKANYRLPWEKAAENPRSSFGITRVVLHDSPEPPKSALTHLRPLFACNEPATLADVTVRYKGQIEASLRAWAAGQAKDDDVLWLNALLRRGLVGNSMTLAPRLESLIHAYRRAEAELSLPRIVPGVADCGPGLDQPVFVRGDCQRPGAPAPRRYLEVLSQSTAPFAASGSPRVQTLAASATNTSGSGRLELAERIANPGNPLTARVMVNRIWHNLFGTGIVRTVDDFGHVGDPPSHPELLDYLAARFVEEGWSVKRLIRSLVLTRTFQLANQPSAASQEIDPQNRLLQHYPARRMEAEAIRDSILATSGRLDHALFGLSIQPHREKEYADRRLFPGPLDGRGRRSIYIKNNLMESPKFLGAFNFPGGKVAQGRRDVTNVPAQALALLNDPFVVQQAEAWADRLIAGADASVASRIDAMFEGALSRAPSEDERVRFTQAVAQLAELHQVAPGDVLQSRIVWKDTAHALLNLQEFIYIP